MESCPAQSWVLRSSAPPFFARLYTFMPNAVLVGCRWCSPSPSHAGGPAAFRKQRSPGFARLYRLCYRPAIDTPRRSDLNRSLIEEKYARARTAPQRSNAISPSPCANPDSTT
jgi:hypothetical protein